MDPLAGVYGAVSRQVRDFYRLVPVNGVMSQNDQLCEGLWPSQLRISAERCCNQRLLPSVAMLDLGTFLGVSYPLGLPPPGSGRVSRLRDVTAHAELAWACVVPLSDSLAA